MNYGAQVSVMFGSLEAKGNGVVCDLPAVCEFLRVFSKDISDLPPKQEIDFNIDLVSATSPISMALYEMFSFELRELKKQMEKLLEKRFV